MRLTTSRRSEARRSTPLLRLSAAWASILTVAGLLLVFALDRETGSAPIQHLYYLPIVFAGMRFRMRGGSIAGLAAVFLYHAANPHLLTFRYEESDLVQIALFIGTGVVTAKLARDAAELHALAMTDDLTGLHNLRSFEARLREMIRASRTTGAPLSLLVLDVDRLKSLNDVHGHLAGAEAVRTVGHILEEFLPPSAVACRYGGDEFVVALPDCAEPCAKGIAEDLRRAVRGIAPTLVRVRFPVGTLSISVGVACRVFQAAGGEAESGESLFRAADRALYCAKEHGRNHVWVA